MVIRSGYLILKLLIFREFYFLEILVKNEMFINIFVYGGSFVEGCLVVYYLFKKYF